MVKFIRIIHLLSLVMFLGSIISFIIIGEMASKSNNLDIISFAKNYTYFTTKAVTTPGMWFLILSGIVLSYKSGYHIRSTGWLKAKLLISLFVIINATFLIMPATTELAHIALESQIKGVLNPEMVKYQWREDIFGTINVVGIFANMLIVIFFKKKLYPATY